MIGFSLLSYVFSIYRYRNLKRSNTLLEEKVKIRTKALNESLENLKSTQVQLVQSEKMASLGELTAGIAHEIQNPLNFVNNFSEVSNELIDEVLAERKKAKDDRDEALEEEILGDLKQNLTKIYHHGNRAADIVKGMLQHSRASTGLKEPTDVNALCDEYLRLAYHGLRAKDKAFNATMETNLDPTLPKIEVVSQDIGRVLLNLITNAFYAVNERSKNAERADSPSGEGGKNGKKLESNYIPTVSISTIHTDSPSGAGLPKSQQSGGERGKGDFIQISIKDNGSGIPNHIKDKIFQPFFTTKPTGQGTGLGLSLAYDIVKAHGGELKVESEEGKGTTFTITLPN